MRANAHIETMSNGKPRIVVTELPYQVNKARLIEKIAQLVRDKLYGYRLTLAKGPVARIRAPGREERAHGERARPYRGRGSRRDRLDQGPTARMPGPWL